MKLISIIGSPRKNANTHFLAQKFCEGVENMGWETKEIFLSKMKISPCLHCLGCEDTGECVQDDDMKNIIAQMRKADALLLSSPVYCCSVTAQVKIMMDRSYCMMAPTWDTGMEGKSAAFIVGAGLPAPEDRSKWEEYGFEFKHKMRISTALKLNRDWKMVQHGLKIRDVIDPMGGYDPTGDTLKVLYQYASILGMEVLGGLDFIGLGHNRKAVQKRPTEIERAFTFGAKFGMMATALKQDAYMA